MGFFSKLFGGDKNAEKAAKDILNSLFADAEKKQNDPAEKKEEQKTKPEAQPQQSCDSGSEWDNIPAEECQYNYGGSFEQYFEHIFAEDFPAYRTEKANIGKGRARIAYTFYSGASKALVIELMSEKSETYKLRKDCMADGIPYLRFYYDHEGWWNKRSYVTERIKAILG